MKLLHLVCVLIAALLLVDAAVAFRLPDQQQQGQGQGQGQEQGPGQVEQSPYVFQDHHFTTITQTQHGWIRELPRFTQRSELLRGIDNYRFAVLEADPNTFVLPHHNDAQTIIFVSQGYGVVKFIFQDRTESFDIRRGDIFLVPSGVTTYLVNRDNRQRLVLVKLLQPVFSPGHYEIFFGAGGENPASLYRVFSNSVLEAVFNTRWQQVERIFRQDQGVFIQVSEQQIRALSQHEGTGIWPFHREHQPTFNIFQKTPTHSNQYGRHYEANYNDYRRLQDLDVAVSVWNISRGGMTAPFISSKATKLIVVLEDPGREARFELISPRLSSAGEQGWQQEQGGSAGSEQETRGGPLYERVSGPLRRFTLVIVPAGHPFVAVASRDRNLVLFAYEVNAFGNEEFALGGKNNVLGNLDDPAKEISFGAPSREVDEVLRGQQLEYFLRGPQQQGQGEGGRADE